MGDDKKLNIIIGLLLFIAIAIIYFYVSSNKSYNNSLKKVKRVVNDTFNIIDDRKHLISKIRSRAKGVVEDSIDRNSEKLEKIIKEMGNGD